MGKNNLVRAIQDRISKSDQIRAGDIDSPPKCRQCGKSMPFEKYNKKSPQDDFITHVVPGSDEYTPPKEVLYCDVSCFMREMDRFE